MKVLSTLAVASILLLLPGCLVAAMNRITNVREATDVKFADNDKDAFVLILAEPSPVPYALHITGFDELTGELMLRSFFKVEPSNSPAYLAKRIAPGTYVLAALYHQLGWAACFSGKTLEFTVNAGDAVFLGDFQPRVNLAQIEDLTRKAGVTTIVGLHTVFFYDGIIPPQISRPIADSPDFLEAKRYEAASLPTLHDRLKPVVYKPAKFTPGSDLGGNPQCLQ